VRGRQRDHVIGGCGRGRTIILSKGNIKVVGPSGSSARKTAILARRESRASARHHGTRTGKIKSQKEHEAGVEHPVAASGLRRRVMHIKNRIG